ncbi:PREDICTED: ferrochelatase-like, partial [Priapulus caudatus]|uniref:Ferrochelatase-like n=1 Tax=Priapulus caudatus TaxID=37621 RepID=A0ABM1F7U0_PRICU
MQARFKGKVIAELAMRYGKPSIESALDKLKHHGVRRILVLPLYPQYSATTTATTYDEVNRILSQWRWIPEMRFVNEYYDHPAYIDALAQKLELQDDQYLVTFQSRFGKAEWLKPYTDKSLQELPSRGI